MPNNESRTGTSDFFGKSPLLSVLPAVVFFCAIYFQIAKFRYLVNDDYQLIYTAWRQAIGDIPNNDFYINSFHFLTIPLQFFMKHFDKGLAFIYILRAVLFLVLAGCAYLVYSISKTMFSKPSAILAVFFVLSSTPMLVRGYDVRPDLITSLLWLIILNLNKPGSQPRPWLTGLFLGIAIVNRFKAGWILPCLLAFEFIQINWPKTQNEKWQLLVKKVFSVVKMGAFAFLPLALYFGYIFLSNEWPAFVESYIDMKSYLSGSTGSGDRVRLQTMTQFLRTDWFFILFFFIGLFSRSTLKSNTSFKVLLLGLSMGFIWLNPAFFAYNLVVIVPLMAPFAGEALLTIFNIAFKKMSQAKKPLLFFLICLCVVLPKARLMGNLVSLNLLNHQMQLQSFIDQYIPNDSTVFAFEGIGMFRKSTYHWRSASFMLQVYKQKGLDLRAELLEARPSLIIQSYRVPSWLDKGAQEFIQENYIQITPYIMFPGKKFLPGFYEEVTMIEHGFYKLVGPPGLTVSINGVDQFVGDEVEINGPFSMNLESEVCLLIKSYPDDALKLLANPKGIPYLIAPSLRYSD